MPKVDEEETEPSTKGQEPHKVLVEQEVVSVEMQGSIVALEVQETGLAAVAVEDRFLDRVVLEDSVVAAVAVVPVLGAEMLVQEEQRVFMAALADKDAAALDLEAAAVLVSVVPFLTDRMTFQ